MGDMADFSMEGFFDMYEDPDPKDWFRESPTCNRCGKEDLEWAETENGWRLFDLDEECLHVCGVSEDDAADGFTV